MEGVAEKLATPADHPKGKEFLVGWKASVTRSIVNYVKQTRRRPTTLVNLQEVGMKEFWNTW